MVKVHPLISLVTLTILGIYAFGPRLPLKSGMPIYPLQISICHSFTAISPSILFPAVFFREEGLLYK